MPVFDDLLASASDLCKSRINKITKYIENNYPSAIRCIYFCTPGFRCNGYFIGFKCIHDELSIYVTNIKAVKAVTHLYPKVRTTKNAIRFYDSERFNSSAVKTAIDICFLINK